MPSSLLQTCCPSERHRWIITAVTAAGLALTSLIHAPAQAPSRVPTAGACLKAAADFIRKAGDAATAKKQILDLTAAKRRQLEAERRCAAQLSIGTTPSGDLLTLARLYSDIGNDPLARRAITVRLASPGLGEGDRADAMLARIVVITAKSDPARVLEAETWAHELDALDPSVAGQKVAAHARLANWYDGWGYADESQQVRYHASAALAFGKRLPITPPVLSGQAGALGLTLALATSQLAGLHLSKGHGDSALAVLRALRIDHPELSAAEVDPFFAQIGARAALIGQRAAPLQATYWLNAPPGTEQVELVGKVTVIQFTAHWCIPCRDTYPGFVSAAKEFQNKDVQFVFLTDLFGYFADFYRKIPPAEELAAIQEYYLKEHGIPFKIGVWRDPAHPTDPFDAMPSDPNRQHYAQGAGYPGFVVIDRSGVIRRFYTGWNIGDEQNLPELIASLLAEPRY